MSNIFDSLKRIVESVVARVLYHPQYAGRVVAQNTDGTVDVTVDSATMPGMSGIPLKHGLPGVRVRVRQGARVLVGHENGDPTRPYAALWGEDQTTIRVRVTTTDAASIPAGSTLEKPSDATKVYVVVNAVTTTAATTVEVTIAPQGEGAGYTVAVGDTLNFIPSISNVTTATTVLDALTAPESVVESVEFDRGTKSVARVGDAVGCGTVTGTNGGGPVTFTFIPEGGGAPVVSTTLTIVGVVTEGNDKLKA